MMRTHLRDELDLLQWIGALDEDELEQAPVRGHEASFVVRRTRLDPRRPICKRACRQREV
jgi:hypothetical protein